jgi:hypothetical protein
LRQRPAFTSDICQRGRGLNAGGRAFGNRLSRGCARGRGAGAGAHLRGGSGAYHAIVLRHDALHPVMDGERGERRSGGDLGGANDDVTAGESPGKANHLQLGTTRVIHWIPPVETEYITCGAAAVFSFEPALFMSV